MGQIVGPETLVFNLNQTPGNYPKEDNLNTLKHGESLKFNKIYVLCYNFATHTAGFSRHVLNTKQLLNYFKAAHTVSVSVSTTYNH
jgi:hypothetical protein